MRQLFFLCCLPILVWSQHATYAPIIDTTLPRQLQIDQHSLHAELDFEPENGAVFGSAKLTFSSLVDGLDSLWLDGPGIDIRYIVDAQNKSLNYRKFDEGIAIFPAEPWHAKDTILITITYEAHPQKGLYFVGWDDPTNRARKQIWTQGQGIDHRHWLPHVDAQNDKLLTSLTIYFDSSFQVIANGKLTERTTLENGKARTTYVLNRPHSSYLMMLAIGKYDFFEEQSASNIALLNYYYPDWKYRNATTYLKNIEIFNFLESEIGVPYPWGENYKQVPVMNFLHGAMENTSATIFGDFFCTDSISFNDRNYVGVNAHELAHQWFGNLVTSPHSRDHWLHEGFASYFAWQAENYVFGGDKYRFGRWQSINRITAAELRDQYPMAHGKAGTERFYDKGGWVLHMLRKEVGDENFKRSIQYFLEQNKFGLATTEDLLAAFNVQTGRDLTWFFDQWVFRPGIPQLNLTFFEAKKNAVIVVEQTLLENEPPKRLHFLGTITTNQRTIPIDFWIEGGTANFEILLQKKEKLLWCNLDTGLHILANWQMNTPNNITAQAAADWYTWLPNLFVNDETRAALPQAIAESKNYLSEIAYARLLADYTLSANEVGYLAQLQNLEAIRAYVGNVRKLQPEMLPVAEKWLEAQSYDIIQKSLLVLCLSNKPGAQSYLAKTDKIYGTEGNNVRIMWHLLNLAMLSKRDIQELVDFTGPAHDFMTRMSAFETCSVLGLVTEDIVENTFLALMQNNRRLRNGAISFITETQKQQTVREMYQDWLNENFGKLPQDMQQRVQSVFTDYTFLE